MLNKNIFVIFAAAVVVLTGCEEELSVPREGSDKVMVVNGSLCSLESEHAIRLCCSSQADGLVAPPAAKVGIYVNGTLAGESSEGEADSRDDGVVVVYKVPASFAPGDEVRVVVDSELGRCEAVQTVPPLPDARKFTHGEEVSLSYSEYGNVQTRDFVKLYLTVNDPAGEKNAYRIPRAYINGDTVMVEEGRNPDRGWTGQGVTYSSSKQVKIFNLLEPALRLPWDPLESENEFNIFSDENFDGRQYSLTLCMMGDFSGAEYLGYPSLGSVEVGGVRYSDLWVRHSTVRLILEALPYESYRYYMAVEYDSNNNTIPLAYEPAVFPSNVSGGLGFINVSSATTVSCTLPDVWFDIDHTHGYFKN